MYFYYQGEPTHAIFSRVILTELVQEVSSDPTEEFIQWDLQINSLVLFPLCKLILHIKINHKYYKNLNLKQNKLMFLKTHFKYKIIKLHS